MAANIFCVRAFILTRDSSAIILQIYLPGLYNVILSLHMLQEISDFDTSISGPWMKQWEIVHVNQHVDNLKKVEAKGGVTWHANKKDVHVP